MWVPELRFISRYNTQIPEYATRPTKSVTEKEIQNKDQVIIYLSIYFEHKEHRDPRVYSPLKGFPATLTHVFK